ncbi:MAG: hypothetical protein ACTHMJ_17465 [Thermomicrobiales bacterium]
MSRHRAEDALWAANAAQYPRLNPEAQQATWNRLYRLAYGVDAMPLVDTPGGVSQGHIQAEGESVATTYDELEQWFRLQGLA